MNKIGFYDDGRKTCPFCTCNCTSIEHAYANMHDTVWVECLACGARGPMSDSSKKAIKSWNETHRREIG